MHIIAQSSPHTTQAVTTRDVEAILSLFASDAILEDPVGAGRPVIGMDALRDFYTSICGRGLTLRIDGHISCARANVACAPIRIDADTSITRAVSAGAVRRARPHHSL